VRQAEEQVNLRKAELLSLRADIARTKMQLEFSQKSIRRPPSNRGVLQRQPAPQPEASQSTGTVLPGIDLPGMHPDAAATPQPAAAAAPSLRMSCSNRLRQNATPADQKKRNLKLTNLKLKKLARS